MVLVPCWDRPNGFVRALQSVLHLRLLPDLYPCVHGSALAEGRIPEITMGLTDWQSNSAYEFVQQCDAPGFAWEFLRRNPEFISDVNALESSGRRIPTNAQKQAFARKWGLRFRAARRCPRYRASAMDSPRVAKHRRRHKHRYRTS